MKRPSVEREAFKPKMFKGDTPVERVPARLRCLRLRRCRVRARRSADLGWIVILAALAVSVIAGLQILG